MINFSKQKMEIKCPECNSNVKITLQQVSNESTVICPRGHKIQLQDKKGSLKKGIRDMNKSMKDFERTLKMFGK